jgi:class 3 adenylate cyclase/ABC-type antimicrobial peptide transport system permease subunit
MARTLFTALAIALGVGMIFAMRLFGVAIAQSAREARASRLAGADLEVTGATSLKIPASLADDLAARPKVEVAAPLYRALEGALDLSASTQAGPLGGVVLKGTGLALLGVDPARALAPYELVAGEFFMPQDTKCLEDTSCLTWEVLLPSQWAAQNGVGVGSTVSLTTGEQTREYTVVGLLKADAVGGQPTAWLPLKTLQAAFSAPDSATAILVRLKPGTAHDEARDELQESLGSQYIVTSTSGGAGVGSIFEITSFALPFAGLAVLLAGSFLVFNAFAITLAERRREIGQLRTLGMTRGQVMAQTLSEATLTALFGSAIGLVFGWGVGYGAILVVQQLQGEGTVPDVPLPLDGALLAVGAGVLITLAVTFNLAREAARVSPLVALRAEQETEKRPSASLRLVSSGGLGLALILGAIVMSFIANNAAQQPNLSLSLTVAAIALSPLLLAGGALGLLLPWVNGVIWAWEKIAASRLSRGGLGVAARLAAGSLARQRTRAALTAATLTIGLMLITALSGLTLMFTDFVGGMSGFLRGDFLLVRPNPPGMSFEQAVALPSHPPLPEALKAELAELADEATVFYMANASLPGLGVPTAGAGSDRYGFAMSLDMARDNPAFPVVEGSWEEAERYFASGPALILPEYTARRLGKHPGDTILVDTVKGKVPFTVAFVGGGFPVVTTEIGATYFETHPGFILVTARAGQDKEALEAKLQALAQKHGLAFTADLSSTFESVGAALIGPISGLFLGLTSLSGLVAALGIVVTLIASVLERQRELGTLRALGMTAAHIRALVVAEAGLLGLAGATLGAVAGLAAYFVFVRIMVIYLDAFVGVTFFKEISYPWQVAGAAVVIGPATAMLAALWPADRAASVNPAEAMRAEGATGFLKPAAHLGPTGLRGLVARMPLAAKLSFTTGLVIVLTIGALTALRVSYERQLLEDNIRAILARALDGLVQVTESQLPAEVTELTPAVIADLQRQADAQAESLNALFLGGDSRYAFSLKYVFITDNDHKVLLTNKAEFTGRVLTETVTLTGSSSDIRLTNWTGERAFEAVVPIENEAGMRLGYVRLGLSTGPVDNIVRDIVRGSAWSMLVALAVAIALTVLFTRRALAPVAQIAEASRSVARGDLTQRVPEIRWDEVGGLARSFNDMVKGLNERERMRDLFGRYVSREVREEVLAGRVSLKGERKTITVLYCDMRDSTAFAEAHPPEEVVAALNQYFEVVILATETYGGIVNRFVGDEAVCVFGAPTEYRDHAERAVEAALAMREGLAYVNQKRVALGQSLLKFGMGLNTGEVTAGATGSEERQEYTVIGDAMNLGARIQDLNKTFPDYGILLSEFTLAALGPLAKGYEFADLGEPEIRGKSQLVRVYGLIGARG